MAISKNEPLWKIDARSNLYALVLWGGEWKSTKTTGRRRGSYKGSVDIEYKGGPTTGDSWWKGRSSE